MPIKCSRAASCLAPLCPCDPELGSAFWYPREYICPRRWPSGRVPPWILAQRIIARYAKDREACYNVAELATARVVQGVVLLAEDRVRECSTAAQLRWLGSLHSRPASQRSREIRDFVLRGAYAAGGYLEEVLATAGV